ncbi:hypothetical protein FIA58_013900 [Flavobacterium jejuense]|uniref:Uncharacterized protein n=1 Tax=Flavobacterium jejuense TaxID=1544455 RepID=A0ABX0ISH7_9FLAO|nr:hypothetical protein [Flavobacterium jejuense]NHN26774.1 hypothetical protein [Flavobacterium jejuense]
MTKSERLTNRNEAVRKFFYSTLEKNPKWKISAVIEEVASKFFLSSRTVDAIISYEGIYADNVKKQKTSQLKLL